jgi:hypothetical protein
MGRPLAARKGDSGGAVQHQQEAADGGADAGQAVNSRRSRAISTQAGRGWTRRRAPSADEGPRHLTRATPRHEPRAARKHRPRHQRTSGAGTNDAAAGIDDRPEPRPPTAARSSVSRPPARRAAGPRARGGRPTAPGRALRHAPRRLPSRSASRAGRRTRRMAMPAAAVRRRRARGNGDGSIAASPRSRRRAADQQQRRTSRCGHRQR